ncbi:MAG: hypothetical protein J1G02_06615 [Clostridiales bacterium]|nr:hypothetical protein [Clostridiales bacterium]
MKTFVKTLRTIFIVVAVMLLVIVAVLYYVDTPVVEEGQEPTLPQKIIIVGKEKLTEILAALGVTGIAAITFLVNKIKSSASSTLTESQSTGEGVRGLVTKVNEQQEIIKHQDEQISVLTDKLDILSNVIMTVFSLSDMPTNVRGIVHAGQEEYKGLGAVKTIVKQVAESVKNAVVESTPAVEDEVASVDDMATPTTGPVYD